MFTEYTEGTRRFPDSAILLNFSVTSGSLPCTPWSSLVFPERKILVHGTHGSNPRISRILLDFPRFYGMSMRVSSLGLIGQMSTSSLSLPNRGHFNIGERGHYYFGLPSGFAWLTHLVPYGINRARARGRGVAGLTRGPVKAETAGPNPVAPARQPTESWSVFLLS